MIKMKRLAALVIVFSLILACLTGAVADAANIWILGAYPSEPVGTMDVYFQATDANNQFVSVDKEKLSFRVDNSIVLNNVLNVTTAGGISYIFVADLSGCYYQADNESVSTALSTAVNGLRSQDNAYFVTVTKSTVESAGYMTAEQAREYVGNLKFNTKKRQQTAEIQAPLWDGINAAGVQASQNTDAAKAVKVVMIFTDGVDNEKGKSVEQVLSVFGNCKGTLVYSFVAVGSEESGDSRIKNSAVKSRDGLQRLKNQNGGNYYPVNSVAAGEQDASRTVQEIQNILCATVDIVPLNGSGDQEYPMDLIYDGSDRKVSVSTSVRINRAAVPTPTPAPATPVPDVQYTWEQLEQRPADLATIQTALVDGHYLAARSGEVDKETKQALYDFCVVNNCKNMNEGISVEAWNLIKSGSSKPKPTPTPVPNTPIPDVQFTWEELEQQPADLNTIQTALFNGYYLAERSGEVDKETKQALFDFCVVNNCKNVNEGISIEAWQMIREGNWKPANTPEPKTETPTPAPRMKNGLVLQLNFEANDQGTVILVQNQLELLGYLNGNYNKGEYDATTHQAVLNYCKAKGLPESTDGLTEEAYNALMIEKPTPSPTPSPTPTPAPTDHPFAQGNEDEDPLITAYQNRLNELGYYEGKTFTPGYFDEATQAAQDRFCEVNNIEKQQGASVELQQTVMSAAAKPNEQRPLLERVRLTLTGETEIVGIVIPTWALVAVIAVLAIAAIVVIVLLLKSNRKPSQQEEPVSRESVPGVSALPQNQILPGSLEETVDMSGGDDSLNMTVVGESQNITLRIDYNGSSIDKAYELSEGIPLVIGRGTDADIRTNKDDMRISRKHGQFSYRNGAVYYRDISKTGTMIDGQMVHEDEVEVHSGTTMHISNHVIKIQM